MKKFFKLITAKSCPVHCAIRDAAVERLTVKGFFSKKQVLDDTNYGAMEDAIRWDYIRRMIEEEHSTELIPLAGRAFLKQKGEEGPEVNPARYIASGYGKRTAGFAMMTEANGKLVLAQLDRKQRVAEGVVSAFRASRQVAAKAGVALPDHSPKQLDVSDDAA